MDLARRTWGGARKGAGRKKLQGSHDAPHRRRPKLDRHTPVHVVLRVKQDVDRLRKGKAYSAVRRVLSVMLGLAAFRVVHVSIQKNHFHFLVEAEDKVLLSRSMQGLAIRLAHAINQATGHEGKVFAFRYHATQITSPRQARNALAYVLNNWRRHREHLAGERQRKAFVDPYSSALAFSGWVGIGRFEIPEGFEPLPVADPRTWLLRVGWQRHGELDPFEVPGPLA
jgi:putative transposase